MATRPVGIIMNGVTGRMGLNQHLVRSILAIRNQGGVALPDRDRLLPDPILVGRNESKLMEIARAHGLERASTDLDACLRNPADTIYFDATSTSVRADHVRRAIAAGKHVYCEKPLATTAAEALELARLARRRGVKHGVVQDKLFLPGIVKLKRLVSSGFFGRILSVRGEFGYWVFEGDWGGQAAQRPSWNYRKEDGGSIILDMFAHWRYLLDRTFGEVKAVQCLGATHIPERVDERGRRYAATADDAAYATFMLAGPEGGGDIVAQFNSSWAVRVYRDDLLQIQVDGTLGSAVAGLRQCKTQPRVKTPRPVWNPDVPNPFDFYEQWQDVPDTGEFDNAFKVEWEMFLRHVAADEPFPHDFSEGAKGVQLAELALQSWAERRWIDVPPLESSLSSPPVPLSAMRRGGTARVPPLPKGEGDRG
jgi:predicted dehydrogenase